MAAHSGRERRARRGRAGLRGAWEGQGWWRGRGLLGAAPGEPADGVMVPWKSRGVHTMWTRRAGVLRTPLPRVYVSNNV